MTYYSPTQYTHLSQEQQKLAELEEEFHQACREAAYDFYTLTKEDIANHEPWTQDWQYNSRYCINSGDVTVFKDEVRISLYLAHRQDYEEFHFPLEFVLDPAAYRETYSKLQAQAAAERQKDKEEEVRQKEAWERQTFERLKQKFDPEDYSNRASK